jgi:hypothetical protein
MKEVGGRYATVIGHGILYLEPAIRIQGPVADIQHCRIMKRADDFNTVSFLSKLVFVNFSERYFLN